MDHYKAEIATGNRFFKEGEADILWRQNVNLDDWDYMIFIEDPEKKVLDQGDKEPEWHLQKMLNGCCSNKWYQGIKFRGKIYTIGIAYHA